MYDINQLRGKRVTVMGLGLNDGGLTTVKWLIKQGATVTVTDLRDKKTLLPTIKKIPRAKSITYILGKHRNIDFEKSDLIIKNPGVPRDSQFLALARKKNIPIETDISLFFRLCPSRTIGITGTKGKSTTTSLIFHIFKKAKRQVFIGGNIRISPLTFIGQINKKATVILELSSWQLEDMIHLHKSPTIAVMTNIMPDHLNRYKNIQEYAKSKKLIIDFQHFNDRAILNRDNIFTRKIGKSVRGHRFWYSHRRFSEENGSFVSGNKIVFRNNGREHVACQLSDISIPGAHAVYNVLAAVTVAASEGIPLSVIKTAVRSFKGIPDRLEKIGEEKGRIFYNDTTATAPDAAIAALHSFPKHRIILLAGGFDKKLAYHQMARAIKARAFFCLLFSGTATKKIVHELKKLSYNNFTVVNSMSQAVRSAWDISRPGDTILLSPGAASFGIFLNEFDRGNQFKKNVSSTH